MTNMDALLHLLAEKNIGATKHVLRDDGTSQFMWHVDDHDDRFFTVEESREDRSSFLVVVRDDKPLVGNLAYGTAAAVVVRGPEAVLRVVEYLGEHMGGGTPVCADFLALMV